MFFKCMWPAQGEAYKVCLREWAGATRHKKEDCFHLVFWSLAVNAQRVGGFFYALIGKRQLSFTAVLRFVLKNICTGKRKKLQAYKPDSVFRQIVGTSAIYLVPGITAGICAAYPPCRDLRPLWTSHPHPETGRQGLFGISTRKVYPPHVLLRGAVRFYRTFSPLPWSFKAVIFCDTLYAPTGSGDSTR